MNQAILDDAILYQALGFDIILVDSNKNPGIVKDWPTHVWDANEFESWLARRDDLSLALRLGDYIDVEVDADDESERQRIEEILIRELPANTVSWRSRRGRHWLMKFPGTWRQQLIDRGCPSVIKDLNGIEWRLGLKPAQSLIPTPGNDYRVWIVKPQAGIVPELVHSNIGHLLAHIEKHEPDNDYVKPESQRPGDVFNDSVEWDSILHPAGWRTFGERGHVTNWTRPGKATGLSATTGYCGTDNRPDCFYVFSSAAEIAPFECNKTYTKFEAWALLNFDGDYRAAASAAMRSGYAPDVDNSCSEFDDIETIPYLQATVKEMPIKSVFVNKSDTPEPDDLIYDFVLGKYVQDLIPYTEAYPPAILFQLLEVAGILVGRRTYFLHGEYPFRLNGGTIVIGESGVSRKGTGLLYARAPFRDHEHEETINKLISENTQVSGEGFIQAIANRENHTLLVACEEFASVLKSSKREGSNLSMIIRNAMDAKSLGIDARKNAIPEMHDAFASIIGHCTLDEFISNISLEDINNGFLNRFQFTMSRQNSKISFPKRVPDSIKDTVRNAFSKLITPQEFAPTTILEFAPDAEPLWDNFYQTPGEDRSSMRESLAARVPGQVLRNASRIALLEGSTKVDARRLKIALAMLKYSQSCIDYIFGDYLNDDEDDLIQFIMSDKNGKSMHDVNEWISRGRKPKRQIKRTITRLLDKRIIVSKAVKVTEGVGRPANRFVFVGK